MFELLAKEDALAMGEAKALSMSEGGALARTRWPTRRAYVSLDLPNVEKFEFFEPLNGGGPFAASGEGVLSIIDGRKNVAAAKAANDVAALAALASMMWGAVRQWP